MHELRNWLYLELLLLSAARKAWIVLTIGLVIWSISAWYLHAAFENYQAQVAAAHEPIAGMLRALEGIVAVRYEAALKGIFWAAIWGAFATYLKERKRLLKAL